MLRYSEGFVGEGLLFEAELWPPPSEPAPAACWYHNLFSPYQHLNFFANESPVGPAAVSIRLLEQGNYLVILRTKQGVETLEIPQKDVKKKSSSFLGRFFTKKYSLERHLIATIKPELAVARWYANTSEGVKKRLLDLETPDVFNGKYRIGLVYSLPHQIHENEIFSNTEPSPAFQEFLEFIGEYVTLQGFTKYAGGLDTTNGTSGQQSLYTDWGGEEIMWHVPTLMPFFAADEQQLERKKHVGNDRAVIIFRDEGSELVPLPANTIASNAIHLVFVVQPFHEEDDPEVQYRIAIASKLSVPAYDPPVPEKATFKKNHEFKDFIIRKLINGIQASSLADEFKPLMSFKYSASLAALCADYGVKNEKKESPDD